MKSAKKKGSRNEHRSMKWLEAQGYICTRAAGSLGLWDIVAVGKDDVLLVQVKSNRWPGTAEMRALRFFEAPACYCGSTSYHAGTHVRKVIHRWRDGRREPDVQWIR